MDQASYGWHAKCAGPPKLRQRSAGRRRDTEAQRRWTSIGYRPQPINICPLPYLPSSMRFADAETETFRSVVTELPDNLPVDQWREGCSVPQQCLPNKRSTCSNNAGDSFHTRKYRPWRPPTSGLEWHRITSDDEAPLDRRPRIVDPA